jgi:hypothetical protein
MQLLVASWTKATISCDSATIMIIEILSENAASTMITKGL